MILCLQFVYIDIAVLGPAAFNNANNHIFCVLGTTCIKVKEKKTHELKSDNVKMACLITQPDKHQQNQTKE